MAQESTRILLRRAWLKAMQDGGARIECASEKEAQRMRFALYNVVRGVRKGEEDNPELLAATESIQLVIEGTAVVMQQSFSETGLESLQALATGVTGSEDGELSTGAFRRLMEAQKEAEQALRENARTTPYYNREGE